MQKYYKIITLKKVHLDIKNIIISSSFMNTNSLNYRWLKNVSDLSVDKFAEPGIDSDKFNFQFNLAIKYFFNGAH